MGPVPILNAASLIHARRPPYGGLLDDIYNEHPYALDMYVLFYRTDRLGKSGLYRHFIKRQVKLNGSHRYFRTKS